MKALNYNFSEYRFLRVEMGGTDLVLYTVLGFIILSMLNLLSLMPGSCIRRDNRDISEMIRTGMCISSYDSFVSGIAEFYTPYDTFFPDIGKNLPIFL
jgi:hypothetical protein